MHNTMAGIALMFGGALANALAFTGSNYLLSLFKDCDIEEERLRHGLVVEQLQAANAAWAQKTTKRTDFIQDELLRQGHAVQTFQDADAVLQEYALVMPTKSMIPFEPQLTDFYHPFDDQQARVIGFIV